MSFGLPAHASESPTYLFVINSQAGRIKGVGKDTGREKLTLTLRGVNDHATQFSDRPIRKAYVLSTADLAARWKRWFSDSAPNAVLTFSHKKDLMPHSVVVKLRKPRYHARQQTLTFTARHIHRAPDLSPDAVERIGLPHRRAPKRFTRGTLFIDSVTEVRTVNGCALQPGTQCPRKNLSDQDLSGADLRGANLQGADLTRADLKGALLRGANLMGATLDGANLSHAKLGATSEEKAASLAFAQLRGVNLEGADLVEVNCDSCLMGTYPFIKIIRTNLSWSDMSGADFSEAYMGQAYLTGAKLIGTNLRFASLWASNTALTDFTGADARGADLSWSGGFASGVSAAKTDKNTKCPNTNPGPCW